jgi:hypothetical protein
MQEDPLREQFENLTKSLSKMKVPPYIYIMLNAQLREAINIIALFEHYTEQEWREDSEE